MEEPYVKLATAIIEQAVKDLNDPITIDDTSFNNLHPTQEEKDQALIFIKESVLIKIVTKALNVDETKARTALLARVGKA